MASRLKGRALALTESQSTRIAALAARMGVSHSAAVRHLIDIALPFAEKGHGLDYARLLMILEYSSIALDRIIQKLAPEDGDHLLDLAIQHARQFHGA